MEKTFNKQDMCDFADWYCNGLLNRERPYPDEAFEKWIVSFR